jgi:DNA-binding NtrC family response regulator
MIVDDEPDICAILKKMLELNGYKVFAFTDPRLALEHFNLNNEKYGIVISDVRMPHMNGTELVAKIREVNSVIPIMLMSAFEPITLNISQSLNVAKFLQKPISPTQLKQAVSDYLRVPAK